MASDFHELSLGAPAVVIGQDAPKSPGGATPLSLIIPGAGQMYQGQIGSAIALLILTIIDYTFVILPGLARHAIVLIDAGS